ncbi:DMT family transporter [Herminiimonas sp. CN]|uniref:DMT family transporter n=1 Tax=Herminiimonas sp. CN TaxID=1349818 RepID=UPI000473487E|nr:DMT family transporter [Herminiimonas sp. CN]
MNTQQKSRQQLWGYLAAAGTVAIWTGFILISRMGGKTALTAYDVMALRLGTASLLLLPFLRGMPDRAWRDRRLWTLALLGGVAYCVLVYAGFKLAPAAHAAILLPGMQPFLVAGAAFLLHGERLTPARCWGLLVIAAGVACVAVPYLGGGWSPALLYGDLLIFAASIVWALYSVLVKRWHYGPWILTRFVTLGSALLYLPVYLLFLPKQLAAVPLSTLLLQGLYQGIGPTILAMLLFLKAVSILGPVRVGALIALVPVLAGVAAAPLLNEALTAWLLGGLVCVSLGALIAARPGRLPAAAAANSRL